MRCGRDSRRQAEASQRGAAGGPVPAPRRRRRRKTLIAAGVVAVVGITVVITLWRGSPTHAALNVLLISVDTLRADHLGLSGYRRPTTQHIDALGREGTVFTQAICQSTNTNPSHATILSGLYPRSHGNLDNFYLMSEDVLLAPDVFRRAVPRADPAESNSGEVGHDCQWGLCYRLFRESCG